MNWYDLHRMRLNFRFENPDKCRSIHSELFMYICDLWNRLWQAKKFWLPTEMTMNLLGIWSYNTYHKAYEDLVSRWFIKEIQKSTNQYSARVIAISKIDKATNKALDKATIKATDETTDDINKQVFNTITINNIYKSEQDIKDRIYKLYDKDIVSQNISKYKLLLLFATKWYDKIKDSKEWCDKFFSDMIDKSNRYWYSAPWFADWDTLLLKSKEMYEWAEWWDRVIKNHMSTLNKFLTPNTPK